MFNGKTHYKWPFSIAMLNYQRVLRIHQVFFSDLMTHQISHCFFIPPSLICRLSLLYVYVPAIKPWHAGKSTSYRSCSHSNLHFIWDSPASYVWLSEEKMNQYSIDTPLYPYCMPIKSPFLLVLRRVITCKFSSFHQRSTCDAVGCRSLHWVAQAGLAADGKGLVESQHQDATNMKQQPPTNKLVVLAYNIKKCWFDWEKLGLCFHVYHDKLELDWVCSGTEDLSNISCYSRCQNYRTELGLRIPIPRGFGSCSMISSNMQIVWVLDVTYMYIYIYVYLHHFVYLSGTPEECT